MSVKHTPALRQRMAWFHTWFGLVLGFLLFVVFWMGTLTVYDKEFDRWMHPDTRRSTTVCCTLTLEELATVLTAAHSIAPKSTNIRLRLPTARQPLTQIRIVEPGQPMQVHWADHRTGLLISNTHTLGGTGFFFPFHYKFNLGWKNVGHFLLGIAGVAMLALLISGVVLHRKLLAEFFLLRTNKHSVRKLLDLHNLSSVVALPFHLLITFTGLLIFFSIYFPWATSAVFAGDQTASQKAMSGFVNLPPSGLDVNMEQQRAALEQVPAMIAARETAWSLALGHSVKADSINLRNLGDENATLEVRRVFPKYSVGMNTHADTLMLYSGEVLHAHEVKPIKGFTHWINGLHFIQFDHAMLRALFFVGGLLGCVMIHTGFLFWLESRRQQHSAKKNPGFVLVQGLAVGGTVGIMIASMAFLLVNQMLPAWVAQRANIETWIFYGVWLVCIAWSMSQAHLQKHLQSQAKLHRKRLWHPPVLAFGWLALLAMLFNQINTGGLWAAWHLQDSNTMTIDVLLLAFAALGFWSAHQLKKAAQHTAT
ncbi:MAG TPA: PepSY-associated TM helix domain-containing protein [Limnobacter sp.]|nr:PepSY-associated TM helix domain-containing protein [Limnobacter sp.]